MVNHRSNFELVLVLTTEADFNRAENLAKALLERRFVACVSLRQVQSHYWWNGQLEQSQEVELLIKTTNGQLKNVWEAIQELHSYDIPEFVHWSGVASMAYKNWISESVEPSL